MSEALVDIVRAEMMFAAGAEQVARVAERRWASYSRRHPKPGTREDRIRDLAKGLRDHFETRAENRRSDGVYREYEYLARKLAALLGE